jgi:hypothetical protein
VPPTPAPHAPRGNGACPSALDASPALVCAALDSAPIPARSLGRGTLPSPGSSARCWGTFWRLGPPAMTGSPTRIRLAVGQCASVDCVRPRTCPSPRCGPVPLRLRVRAPTARLLLAGHARHTSCIGRGQRPRHRLRRQVGACPNLPDFATQPLATILQAAYMARAYGAPRTSSPGPLRGCGFRSCPCHVALLPGVSVRQGDELRKDGKKATASPPRRIRKVKGARNLGTRFASFFPPCYTAEHLSTAQQGEQPCHTPLLTHPLAYQ